MGVEDAEQGVGQFGEFVVELKLDACGQQGEGLDQPFDVRIDAAARLQQQASGRRRVLPGELLRHLPDEQQFAFVVFVKGFAHVAPARRWTE